MSKDVTKARRKRCRVCDALAGITADICTGCRMAEVRSHIKQRGRQGKPQAQQLHEAHGQSLLTLPPVAQPNRDYTSSAIFSAVATGLEAQPDDLHAFNKETLANAQRFAATLGGVPTNVATAQVFFSYSQKSFYNHMRAMLLALDGGKKLPGRKRKTPSKGRKDTAQASSTANVALAKALRFLRIYMHMESVPLALKLNASQTLIWHIESAGCVIAPKWVEAYAKVFDVKETSIYAYAASLEAQAGSKSDYRLMVTEFVDVCLRNKKAPGTQALRQRIFDMDKTDVGLKLTRAIVAKIKRELAKGERAALIADRHNISRHSVHDIKAGRTWQN